MEVNGRLTAQEQHELFRMMLRIRMVEESIAGRYSQWKMRCPTHLCSGQESVAAGVCLALRKDDFVMSTHRSHGHYLAKGGDLKAMLAELYGKKSGCSSGKGGSMHLIAVDVGFMGSTAIVGGTIPLAVGLGLSLNLGNTDRLSCVFFGDAATEEGVFYESLNFAVLKKLPVLFICENNLYSVYSPLSVRQPTVRKIHRIAESLGVPSQWCDASDGREVYLRAAKAAAAIRNGEGPQFIEYATYRYREHCGPNYDDDLDYRPREEVAAWHEKDALSLLERELLAAGTIESESIAGMKKDVAAEIEEAFAFAETSAFPSPEEAAKGVFRPCGEGKR